MRDDIREAISFLAKEDVTLFNKAELARRYGCNPRTIDAYGCTAMAIYKLLLTKGYQGKYRDITQLLLPPRRKNISCKSRINDKI
ncbi:MAG: hypothetical protein IKJ75_04505 [Clostridia bacterium]|nr:hypothetical protein [Clostridia bacterium]